MIVFNFEKLRADNEFSGIDNPNHRPYCCSCRSLARMKPIGEEWLCDPSDRDYKGFFGCGNRFKKTTKEQS